MPPPSKLRDRLRHPDPEVRHGARREIATRVRELDGDVEGAARELGLTPRTVRKWSDWDPFGDFRPEHRDPLEPRDLAARPDPPPGGPEPEPGPTMGGPVEKPESEAPSEGRSPRPHPRRSLAEPTIEGPDPAPAVSPGRRRIVFVLHAHLPWVLGHGRWPHGEEWLTEAALHCYLPLLRSLRRLGASGHRHVLAFSITPVLAAQLADPRFPPAMDRDLQARREAAEALVRSHPLGSWWRDELEALGSFWDELGGDLLGALRALADEEVIELSSAAATHPYLPLLHREQHLRLQLRAARENHLRWFGRPPRGLWMPECAYRPGGPWRHPVTRSSARHRAGNEVFLQEAGFRWTVVDAHLLLGGEPFLGYGFPWAEDAEREPVPLPEEEAPLAERLQPVLVEDSEVAAFVREPHTARQVWARQTGYPGDPSYLDFHKRDENTGLRLWRVTEAEAGLGDKLPYWPPDAEEAAARHAEHFVEMLGKLPGLDDGIALCPYDAELFGHWWFEGPSWLEGVLRGIAAHPRLETTTPGREVDGVPPARRARLAEGSWGEGGDHRVWTSSETRWMWRDLERAETAVHRLLRSRRSRKRSRAAIRQLMLLAASDWPFLITMGTATDYAIRRFRLHRDRLQTLIDATDGEPLPAWAEEDLGSLEVDPRWWHGGNG